jgi:hypothetical protein
MRNNVLQHLLGELNRSCELQAHNLQRPACVAITGSCTAHQQQHHCVRDAQQRKYRHSIVRRDADIQIEQAQNRSAAGIALHCDSLVLSLMMRVPALLLLVVADASRVSACSYGL